MEEGCGVAWKREVGNGKEGKISPTGIQSGIL